MKRLLLILFLHSFCCDVLGAIHKEHPNAEVLGKLVYSDVSIDVKNVGVKEVISTFKEELDLLMNIYWKTDEHDGIDPASSITLTLTDKPALVVLERIVMQCSDNQNVTWQLRHGVLEIGIKKTLAERTLHLETYYIRDLLFTVRNFTAPELGTFGGDGDGGVEDSPSSEAEEIEKIIQLIQRFVEPDLWEENGGPCTITNYKQTLLIKAPDFIHRQISGYGFEALQPSDVKERKVLYKGDRVKIIVDRIPIR